MAINDFPPYGDENVRGNDPEGDLDALMIPQFEDLWGGDRHATPEESDHGDHQEFLGPGESPAADLPDFETPGESDHAFPTFDAANDPPDRGVPERGPVVSDFGEKPDWDPYEVQPPPPLPEQSFETPGPAEVETSEPGAPGPPAFLPWVFPLPPQDQDEAQPSQFGTPEEAEGQDPTEFAPPEESPQGSPLTFGTPPPVEVPGAAYEQPPPPQVEMGQNEDLFARTGWPVAPPRIVQTHWYM